jgi:hypothetical protein
MRNVRWVVITEPQLRIYSSTTNARCTPRHAIATTANGTSTAIDRYPLRRRIPTTTHTAPSPNRGCLFAGPCIRGSHSGGYEEYYLPRYNAVQFVESLPTFQNNLSLQSSGSNNKLSNKPACKKVARRLHFFKELRHSSALSTWLY